MVVILSVSIFFIQIKIVSHYWLNKYERKLWNNLSSTWKKKKAWSSRINITNFILWSYFDKEMHEILPQNLVY